MIPITLQQIRDAAPCVEGWEKVLKANGGAKADLSKPFPLSSILDSNGLEDTLWTLQCLPEYSSLWRKYAVWCARQVQYLMTDERSINALEVAWHHSDGWATDGELAAAAWSAVWSAAWSAAWSAVWSAARSAARSAADAARSADAQSVKLRQILDAGEWVEDTEVRK